MDILSNWERAEDEKIQELIEIRKKVKHFRRIEEEKKDNVIINNKQFIYTLCNNINKYLNAGNEQERKTYHEIIRNIFNCLKVKCSIYNVLENILNNMYDYEQEQKEDNNIDILVYIENAFNTLKNKLITEYEKEQLKEIKQELNQEQEYNNEDINRIQEKYSKVISFVLLNAGKTIINLLDGEQIELINNDRLIII